MTTDPTTAAPAADSTPLPHRQILERIVALIEAQDFGYNGNDFETAAEQILALVTDDPTLTLHSDGHVEVTWHSPDALGCVAARPVIDALVADLNRMRAGADRTPVPEGVELTDGQWWATILDLPADARARRIAEFRDAVRQGLRCWAEQHRERLDPCEAWSERDAADTSYRCMLPTRYPHAVHWHLAAGTWSVETGGRP